MNTVNQCVAQGNKAQSEEQANFINDIELLSQQ